MKQAFLTLAFLIASICSQAQQTPEADTYRIVSFEETLFAEEINGMNVLETDTFYGYIEKMIQKNARKMDRQTDDYPRIYITSANGSQFVEIWGAPDIGFRHFYTIGYTDNKKRCSDCGIFIGTSAFKSFYIDRGIKLGDRLMNVWRKVNLNFYRRFEFKGTEYFFYDRGVKIEHPFVPYDTYYYKFKKDKLIEIGFGKGFQGVNPMFQPE